MDKPIRFEQEFPEEAQTLMSLCDNKELRHRFRSLSLFNGNSQPYERSQPKISRNDPCPCGSNKKYKKCCG